MSLIIDNNILFSLMNPFSMNSFLFDKIEGEIFATDFIIKEFKKYKKECFKKSKLSEKEFNKRKKIIFSKINFIKFKDFRTFVKNAKEFCPDEDDVFYFALALKLNLPIWSNDKELKRQEKVIVLNTEEIIDLYLG